VQAGLERPQRPQAFDVLPRWPLAQAGPQALA
jgi:hypothetical protein